MKRVVDENEMLSFGSIAEWRAWLEVNHDKKSGVWLLNFKKVTGRRTIDWSDAVDVALCFGWIDSTSRSLDDERYIQYFTRRKAQSTWSKVNKAKVTALKASGLMTNAGLKAIQLAKQNGSWNLLNDVEAVKVPADLKLALTSSPAARKHFQALSKSMKKMLLQWLVLAKTPETRLKRITDIVFNAREGTVPKSFQSVKASNKY